MIAQGFTTSVSIPGGMISSPTHYSYRGGVGGDCDAILLPYGNNSC